jgi:hypothetical protein
MSRPFSVNTTILNYNYHKDLDLSIQNSYLVKSMYSDDTHTQKLEALKVDRPYKHLYATNFMKSLNEMKNSLYDDYFNTKISRLIVPSEGKLLLTSRVKYKLVPINTKHYNLFIKKDAGEQ